MSNDIDTDAHDQPHRDANGLIDRERKPTRAGAFTPDIRGRSTLRSAEVRHEEFMGLAAAIALDIVAEGVLRVREVKPATLLGGGQVSELARRVEEEHIELLLIDAPLTPIQQRNLERETGAKVLDRTALILEIFGERAATREGVLQVELAHLNYQKSRLVRSWTHLERQRGGFGFLGGPGETQIESDRRQLQDRIALLETRLDKVRRTRQLQRGPRAAVPFPMVALVGYTNAGKSSIFNMLTGASVGAQDLLFATLDTTVRKVALPHGRNIVLSDTVGFISELPTDLVAAFRGTLEEVVDAEVVLHVRDVSNPDHAAQAQDVLKVLADLGVSGETRPIIEVWNKVDLLPRDEEGAPDLSGIAPAGPIAASVPISAVTGEGATRLLAIIEDALAREAKIHTVVLPHAQSGETGWLYEHAEVLERREPDEHGTRYRVRVLPRHRTEFLDKFSGLIESDA